MISYLLTFIATIGCVLNIYKDEKCFIVWTFADIGWIWYILYCKNKKMHGQIPLWIIFILINVWGYITWIRG